MIHYTYKVIHPNGKYYIGRHSTNNIEDGYMGSGKWIRSIKDKSVLTKEIISFYPDFDSLKAAEHKLLKENIGGLHCMNFNNNPVGFASGELNPAKSEKEKARKSLLKGQLNSMYGKTHSDNARDKMSSSRKGKSTWNKGLVGIKTSDKGQIAWNKGIHTGHQSFTGKKHTPETIQLLKEFAINRERLTCPHCYRIFDKPNYSKYHGDKCKLKH